MLYEKPIFNFFESGAVSRFAESTSSEHLSQIRSITLNIWNARWCALPSNRGAFSDTFEASGSTEWHTACNTIAVLMTGLERCILVMVFVHHERGNRIGGLEITQLPNATVSSLKELLQALYSRAHDEKLECYVASSARSGLPQHRILLLFDTLNSSSFAELKATYLKDWQTLQWVNMTTETLVPAWKKTN